MSFKDSSKITATLSQMVQSDIPRSRNRGRINTLFNGEAPYTVEEQEQNQQETNVNFLEGTEVVHNARSQYSNAFLKQSRFCTINLQWGPPEKRVGWSSTVTNNLNRIMKRAMRYSMMLENVFAGVTLHGVGPRLWSGEKDWCPTAKGVDEVLVPARTLTDLSNLTHFAVRTFFTLSDLIKRSQSGGSKSGWKMDSVNALIESMRKEGMTQTVSSGMNPWSNIESFDEDIKENGGYWASDAAPVVSCFDFYYLDTSTDKTPKWKRKILIDTVSTPTPVAYTSVKDPLLYDPPYDLGEDLSKIMHVQFADGANKAPFRWHSVRSLGYMLYAPCHLQNRLRCRFNDALFEAMNWYFYDLPGGDGERLRKVDLHNRGVIPDGLKWVPADQRHTVDYNLVSGGISMNQQLIAQRASNFTQDINDGSQKEMSATEAMGRITAASAMVGAMLSRSYNYETAALREVVRRFCTIDHKDCKEFRDKCKKDGVPEECFKHFDDWDVLVERTLGNGNKALELVQASQLRLMKNDAEVSPDARRIIDHLYVTSLTDNPQLAEIIVPLNTQQTSNAVQWATLGWGTLMMGQPVVITAPINRIDYVQTLMAMLTKEIQKINSMGGTPDMDKIIGLANVIQHIQNNLQVLATDEGIADVVREFGDMLGQASNMVKGYFQRAQEEQQASGQQMDPEAQAKVQSIVIQAQTKAHVAEASGEQKRRLKEMQWQQDQQRRNASTAAQIQRDGAKQAVSLAGQTAKTRQELRAAAVKNEQAIAQSAVSHAQDTIQSAVTHEQDVAQASELAEAPESDDKES